MFWCRDVVRCRTSFRFRRPFSAEVSERLPVYLGTWIRTTSTIVKRFDDVNVNISSLSSKLQTVLVTVQNFKDGVESMNKWCEQTRKTFERMTTVSFDVYILQQQIREIKVCISFSSDHVMHKCLPIYILSSYLQDPNDNSMLDMLIGYSCMQIRVLLSLLLLSSSGFILSLFVLHLLSMFFYHMSIFISFLLFKSFRFFRVALRSPLLFLACCSS